MPTSREPTRPGPCVTAIPSMAWKFTPAVAKASPTTSLIFSRCSREASSGTTPPYFLCVAICEAMTFERTLTPSSMTAAAVSSHELSIPRVSIGPYHDICHTLGHAAVRYQLHGLSFSGCGCGRGLASDDDYRAVVLVRIVSGLSAIEDTMAERGDFRAAEFLGQRFDLTDAFVAAIGNLGENAVGVDHQLVAGRERDGRFGECGSGPRAD